MHFSGRADGSKYCSFPILLISRFWVCLRVCFVGVSPFFLLRNLLCVLKERMKQSSSEREPMGKTDLGVINRCLALSLTSAKP